MDVLTTTVREIALHQPSSMRVFERFGIDYCCQGDRPLEQICAGLQLSVEQVLDKLEQAERELKNNTSVNYSHMTLAQLIKHIVRTHHVFVRTELPRLTQLAHKVNSKHGSRLPALATAEATVAQLRVELLGHLSREEEVLFPYIAQMEETVTLQAPQPCACFETAATPVREMAGDHDSAKRLLKQLRDVTSNYELPDWACPTFHAYYLGLQEFEEDLRIHTQLEDEILFPRSIAMESAVKASA